MSTACAGSCTGWFSFATMEPGALYPIATVNTLVNTLVAGMNEMPNTPVLEVQDVLYPDEGMIQSRAPALSFSSLIYSDCEAVAPTSQTLSMTLVAGAALDLHLACLALQTSAVCIVLDPRRRPRSLNILCLVLCRRGLVSFRGS